MKFRDIFETKKSNSIDDFYTRQIQINGQNTIQYTRTQYKAIASEGYCKNWIIYRCMNEIINAAVQLDFVVMRYNKNGEPEEVKNHPAQHVLENPNPATSQSDFIKKALIYYYIGGDVPFVRTPVNNNKEVGSIDAYRPDLMTFELTGDIYNPYRNIRYKGYDEKEISPEDFLLWRNLDPLDDLSGAGRGLSPLKPLLRNGDLLSAMLDWNMSLLNNGGHSSGIITTEKTLTDTQYKRSQATLREEHGGKNKVGKWMLIDGGGKAFSITPSVKDMDWTEGKLQVMKDICVGFGIDPIIIGFNEQSSYNNKEQALKSLYTNKVIPQMRELADLLGPFLMLDKDEYLEVKYDKIPILQDDMKALSEKLSSNTFLTVNKKRTMMGDAEIKGGDVVVNGPYAIVDGQLYLPANLLPVENAENSQNLNNSNQKSFMY